MFYTRKIAALVLLIICCVWINPQAAYAQWKVPAEADTLQSILTLSEEIMEKGQQIYTNQCAMCHGEAGKGDGPAGTVLSPQAADLTSEEFHEQSDGAIFWKIREGRGPMPGYKNSLDEEELWSIVHYLRTFSDDHYPKVLSEDINK